MWLIHSACVLNSKMNSAVVNGTYINTFDALRMGREEAELIIPILDQIFK